MPYQPLSIYQHLPTPTYSAFSRPRHDTAGTYEIHLVRSEDPSYIPEDFEAWPLYQRRIIEFLRKYPDIHREAVQAVNQLREELKGRENPAIPPGTQPKR